MAVSLYTKTTYAFGQLAEGVKNGAFNYLLFFYYQQVLGLSGTLTGLALLIATVFDAITDPVAGSWSDRLHHRWGRRHPFMYASALPLGVTFALLFRPPEGLPPEGVFAWLLVFTVLVRASMTLYHVPHLSLGAELSSDYVERTTIVAFRTVFSIFGGVMALVAAWLVFFAPSTEFENGQLDAASYPPFGLLFGGVMTVTILVSAYATHDQIPKLPRPSESAGRLSLASLRRDYVHALSNRHFRWFFIGVVVFFVTRGIQEVLSVHMSTYFWALSPPQIATLTAATFPAYLLAIPFWTLWSRSLDKRPTFLLGISGFSLFVMGPPAAKLLGAFPAADGPFYLGTLIACAFLASFSAAAGVVMAGSMMADVADDHELKTGARQEGIFFGALAFAGKSTSGLGGFIAGVGLDLLAFPTQAAPEAVPAAKVTSLGVFYGPGVALLAVVGIVCLARYGIDRRRHEEIVAALAARRD